MIYNPSIKMLNEWFSRAPGCTLNQNICSLKGGKWILCGHGKMGRNVYKKLTEKGIDTTVVEPLVENIEDITEHAILGRANLENLKEAGLKDCVGLIAGTDNDTFNLSIIHQANRETPALFSIVRQNKHMNDVLFHRANVDFILEPSLVIARMVLFMLTAPLLKLFFSHLRVLYENDPTQVADITQRLAVDVGGEAPILKTYTINEKMAPAVTLEFARGSTVCLGDIYRDSSDRDKRLKAVPLAHRRGKVVNILPLNDLPLEINDEILFCMVPEEKVLFEANIANEYTLKYFLTGDEPAKGGFFRWLKARSKTSPKNA